MNKFYEYNELIYFLKNIINSLVLEIINIFLLILINLSHYLILEYLF